MALKLDVALPEGTQPCLGVPVSCALVPRLNASAASLQNVTNMPVRIVPIYSCL